MRLSIIIPQYKENEQMLKRLLNSIDLQRQIDFNEIEVLFVNDKSDCPPPNELKSLYPFKIERSPPDKWYTNTNQHKKTKGDTSCHLVKKWEKLLGL